MPKSVNETCSRSNEVNDTLDLHSLQKTRTQDEFSSYHQFKGRLVEGCHKLDFCCYAIFAIFIGTYCPCFIDVLFYSLNTVNQNN